MSLCRGFGYSCYERLSRKNRARNECGLFSVTWRDSTRKWAISCGNAISTIPLYVVRNFASWQDDCFDHPSRHPALTERETAVVGWCLSRFEQGHASHFQMPAQGGHPRDVHGAATADRDFRSFFMVDRNERPFPRPFVTGRRPAPPPGGSATPGPLSGLVDSLCDVSHLVE